MVMDEFYFNIHADVLCQGVKTRGLPAARVCVCVYVGMNLRLSHKKQNLLVVFYSTSMGMSSG